MSNMDFNSAEPQREMGGIIPEGTIAVVVATLNPGQQGDGGWLTANKVGDALMTDFEFTIDGGQFDRRKFWGRFVVQGNGEGHEKAAAISRGLLRGMLESARGIHPTDDSQEALAARCADWGDFDGLRFCAKIGIEKGTNGYKDKNQLRIAVTPNMPGYIAPGASGGSTFKAVGKVAAAAVEKAGAKAAPAGKPAWAN